MWSRVASRFADIRWLPPPKAPQLPSSAHPCRISADTEWRQTVFCCSVPVAVSAAVQGPMLLGFAKPVILLPQRFYGEQELALIRAVHRGKWAVTSAFLLPQENPFSLPDFPDSLNFVLLLLAQQSQPVPSYFYRRWQKFAHSAIPAPPANPYPAAPLSAAAPVRKGLPTAPQSPTR